ncbi:MAG: ABC transporter permease, partial [Spirochaetota bacterium]
MNTLEIAALRALTPNRGKRISIWKKSPSLNAGVVMVGIVLLFAALPGLITALSPTDQDADHILEAPTFAHPFGTDNFGRDVFARVVHGTRIDLTIGVLATLVPFITGSLIGLLAGYYGKWIDSVLMRILDIFMAFPFIILVIAIVAILGPGLNNLYIAIWLVGWKDYARLVRSEVMVAKNAEYVQAAKILGFGDMRVLLRHILPNVLSV